MIRLFVSDIDGCLAMPYEPFRLDRLGKLAGLSREAGTTDSSSDLPALSICSGRSYAYVEAMTQLLSITTPVLFEAGAGMFDVNTGFSKLHPSLTDDVKENLGEIKDFMETVIRNRPGLGMDYGKVSQAALAGKQEHGLFEALDEIGDWVAKNYPTYETFHTHISIDVVPPGLTKLDGLEWLGRELGIEMNEIAFIGDSNGDIGALEACGFSFAPANADPAVKVISDHTSTFCDIDAVLEAYEMAASRH